MSLGNDYVCIGSAQQIENITRLVQNHLNMVTGTKQLWIFEHLRSNDIINERRKVQRSADACVNT